MVNKFDDMFSSFNTIQASDRRTHEQTDILRQHTPRYA